MLWPAPYGSHQNTRTIHSLIPSRRLFYHAVLLLLLSAGCGVTTKHPKTAANEPVRFDTAYTAGDRPVGAGIHLIWAPAYADTFSFVKSIQGMYLWKNVQPGPHTFDFSDLHRDLARAKKMNKRILLQLNMPAPDWIADSVAIVGMSRGGPAPQFWAPAYLRQYKRVLDRFLAEINADNNKHMIIGVRVQPNAFNTEIVEPNNFEAGEPDEQDYTTWKSFPKGFSARNPSFKAGREDKYPGSTETHLQHYLRSVHDYFTEQFQGSGIRTFFRTLLLHRNMPKAYADALFATPLAGVLDTRREFNPAGGMRTRFPLIQERCLNQGLEGMWEESQHQWIGHSWEQDMYYRTLFAVASNVPYIGIYGKHLQYNASFAFANKYANYGNKPEKSPGAWFAFVSNHVVSNGLGFYLNLSGAGIGSFVENISDEQEGAYGFRLPANQAVTLQVDKAFFATIRNKRVNIILKWYDNGAAFELPGIGTATGTGRNAYTQKSFTATLSDPSITIRSVSGNLVLHMVEIEK